MTNARAAAERIIRDGKDAGEVVQRMRALFRKKTLTKADLDVNDVIDEVLRLIHTEVVRKRITVETDLEKRLPLAQGRSRAVAAGDFQLTRQWNRGDGSGELIAPENFWIVRNCGTRTRSLSRFGITGSAWRIRRKPSRLSILRRRRGWGWDCRSVVRS